MILKFLGCDERSRQLNDEWWKIFRAPMPITQAGDGEYMRLYFNFYGLPEYLGWHAYKKWHNKEAREAFADYENSDSSLEELITKYYGAKAVEIIRELTEYSFAELHAAFCAAIIAQKAQAKTKKAKQTELKL